MMNSPTSSGVLISPLFKEILIAQTVIELIKENIQYKKIYQIVKQKLQSFVGLISVKEIYSTDIELYNIKLAS